MEDPQMRVATSGTEAVGKHYSRHTPATPGMVLTATGPDNQPIWAPGGANAEIIVSYVYFVDLLQADPIPDGSLTHPFQLIQDAVDQIITDAVARAVIMCAPAAYGPAIHIPDNGVLQQLVIQGWTGFMATNAPDLLPRINGIITIDQTNAAESRQVTFKGVRLIGNIVSNVPATRDLNVHFQDCVTSRITVEGANVNAYFSTSNCDGVLKGNISLHLWSDGESWSNMVRNVVSFLPTDYLRDFYDTGADETWDQRLNGNAVIGHSIVVECAYVSARPGEYAIGSLIDDPAPTDFIFGFHHCEADKVFFWLRNESRQNGIFDEPLSIVCFHGGMALIPQAPP